MPYAVQLRPSLPSPVIGRGVGGEGLIKRTASSQQTRQAQIQKLFEADIEEFIEHKRNARNLAEATARAYTSDLEHYISWLITVGVTAPHRVKASHVSRYARELGNSPRNDAPQTRMYTPASVTRKLSVLRSWHKFLAREHDYPDPTTKLEGTPTTRRLPRVLSVEQVRSLLECPAREDIIGIRDRAMLELLYDTCLRASQLCGLRLQDLNRKKGLVYCRVRGQKVHPIVYGETARQAMAEYIKVARPKLLSPLMARRLASPLFVREDGKPLYPALLHRIVQQYAQQSGLPEWVTPHTLRHSRAIHLRADGAALGVIQELLGHTHITATEIYNHLDTQHLRESYLKAHPRA